ncbi:transposase [Anoxybacillus voinovskiensis]|uniref:Transposase n=1 Tax=Anoxybacteroides voinovskiense TaxID=230470 RepID=A0A840DRG6_9BACL|nr:IS21 family transposase [Anoxybacillus voinovskiensis]MBB4075711.1 transposase [Anoxybacillus voinovskiensis]GGJ81447.1 transposase [Anoxybacillus voinovskiensis]
MLALAQIEYIKFLREEKGLSIHAIAKQLKVNWRTVKKYADQSNWSPKAKKRTKRYPVLGPYMDIIDAWLEEDRRKKKKQRHTAIRIYERLRDECGFTGGVRTVTEYVSKRKKELAEEQETYVDLHHPGGEAQVDFGTAEVIYEQKRREVKYLVLSFPYSNAAYTVVLPKENIECFLHGLQTLFEYAGGVPQKIWFDNLSAAVVRIEKNGTRQLTELFQRFQLHYGFRAEFCNRGAGHEKGNVENKVGTIRRNWFVPHPVMTSWEQINEVMKQKAEKEMGVLHYEKKRSVQELWEEEKQKLLFLPNEPFEAMYVKSTSLDKYGRLRLDDASFSVAGGVAKQSVWMKVFWDRIEVFDTEYRMMEILPRPYTFQEKEMDWRRELELLRNKPKAIPYTMVFHALPESVQHYLIQADLPKRKGRVSRITGWLKEGYTMEQIAQAISETSAHLLDEEGVLYQALYRQEHPVWSAESLPEPYTPDAFKGYDPDLESYNLLMDRGGSA